MGKADQVGIWSLSASTRLMPTRSNTIIMLHLTYYPDTTFCASSSTLFKSSSLLFI